MLQSPASQGGGGVWSVRRPLAELEERAGMGSPGKAVDLGARDPYL